MRSFARIAAVLALGGAAVLGLSSAAEAAPAVPASCPVLAGQVVGQLSNWVPSQVAAQAGVTVQAVCTANQNWD
jgi:hypothetical protein